MFSHSTNDELDTIRFFLPFFESPDFLVGFLEEMERRNPHRVGIKPPTHHLISSTGDV